MNLDGKLRTKLLILFLITMFSVTNLAHGTENSGNASGKADGTVNCPDGKSNNGELSFSAFKKDGPIYGSWEVVIADSSHDKASNGGYLDSGKIDKNSYDLEGKETASNICGLDKKADISIQGDCGNGKIQVRADTGWKGNFEGNIDCG